MGPARFNIMEEHVCNGDKIINFFFVQYDVSICICILYDVWILHQHLNVQLIYFSEFIMFKCFILFLNAYKKHLVCAYEQWNCRSWRLHNVIFIVSMYTCVLLPTPSFSPLKLYCSSKVWFVWIILLSFHVCVNNVNCKLKKCQTLKSSL